jgi:hypothetical protein
MHLVQCPQEEQLGPQPLLVLAQLSTNQTVELESEV